MAYELTMINYPPNGQNARLKVLHDTGKRLVAARLALGLSEEDFATTLRVDLTAYLDFERGAALPSLEHAIELRAAFGLTLDYIFCGDAGDLPAPLRRQLED